MPSPQVYFEDHPLHFAYVCESHSVDEKTELSHLVKRMSLNNGILEGFVQCLAQVMARGIPRVGVEPIPEPSDSSPRF